MTPLYNGSVGAVSDTDGLEFKKKNACRFFLKKATDSEH